MILELFSYFDSFDFCDVDEFVNHLLSNTIMNFYFSTLRKKAHEKSETDWKHNCYFYSTSVEFKHLYLLIYADRWCAKIDFFSLSCLPTVLLFFRFFLLIFHIDSDEFVAFGYCFFLFSFFCTCLQSCIQSNVHRTHTHTYTLKISLYEDRTILRVLLCLSVSLSHRQWLWLY